MWLARKEVKHYRSTALFLIGMFQCGAIVYLLLSTHRYFLSARLVSPGELQRHVEYLASDDLQGRFPGTDGYNRAARYVTSIYDRLGLAVLPETPGYLQPVPLLHTALRREESMVVVEVDGIPYPIPSHYYLLFPSCTADRLSAAGSVELTVERSIVTGSVAPHCSSAEFTPRAALCAEQNPAISLALSGDLNAQCRPWSSWFPTRESDASVSLFWLADLPHYARWQLEECGFCRSGPEGAVHNEWDQTRTKDEILVGLAPHLVSFVKARLEERYNPVDERREHQITIRAAIAAKRTPTVSPNIIGVIPGAEVPGEAVVVLAHLDHLGVDRSLAGDGVFNGAVDNASGVALLLEVARILARRVTPRRSIIFLVTTAEEAGLLGATYFIQSPIFRRLSLVAAVNLDTVAMFHPLKEVTAYGSERSEWGDLLIKSAARARLRFIPDPWPEARFAERGDQFPFLNAGIPGIMVNGGPDTGDPSRDGRKIDSEWMDIRYHTPIDDIDQKIDYSSTAALGDFVTTLVALLADHGVRPQMKKVN